MNGIDGNAPLQPARNRFRIRHAALVEGFIAGDEDQLQRMGIIRIPF